MFTKQLMVFLFTISSFSIYAQISSQPAGGGTWENNRNKDNWDTKRWTVGVQSGFLAFHGDLAQTKTKNIYGGHFSDTKNAPNGGLIVKYAISHALSLRASAYAGSFHFTNGGFPYGVYTYDITNKIKSLEMQIYANLGNLSFLRHKRQINLFLFTGIGTVFNQFSGVMTATKAPFKDIDLSTDPYWSKRNSPRYATVPTGLGLIYNLNYTIDLAFETGIRYSRTDSMDFADFYEHRNRNFDWFSQSTLALYFKLGSKKNPHYDWINPMETIYEDVADSKKTVKLLAGDADKDGVADYLDKEPNTPEGDKVGINGVAEDTDGDGIPDSRDLEPFSDKGQPVDKDGKMLDADEDGVPNHKDLEPRTPKGNLVNFQGKTIPYAGSKDTTGLAARIAYLPTIFFDTDKWNIKAEYYAVLLSVSQILQQYPDLKLDVVGNADYRLDDDHNNMLGKNRAESAINYLVNFFGVNPDRLRALNNGERVPMVNGRGEEYDALNRRVNFYILGTTGIKIK